MKWRVQECRSCKIETDHRVRRVCFKPHGGRSSGGTKYIVEHCTKCNKRWYDGKQKGERELERKERKREKTISLR